MYSLFLYSYANQMVVDYNVQCETGKLVSNSLHLESNNCPDGTTMRCMLLKKNQCCRFYVLVNVHRCQDYIEIDAGTGGHREFCGNSLPSKPLVVGTGM